MGLRTIAGITNVTVSASTGAVVLSVAGAVTVRLSGWTREVKVGASGVAGVKKTPMQGRMTIECHDGVEFLHEEFRDWDAVSVQAVAATGKVYMLNGSIVGDPPELDLVEGTFTLEFEGECEEIVD